MTSYGRNKNHAYEIKSQEMPINNPSYCFEAIEQKKVIDEQLYLENFQKSLRKRKLLHQTTGEKLID